MFSPAFFHARSGTVRFWVHIGDELVGARIGQETLHYRYESPMTRTNPLTTYLQHGSELRELVRQRVAGGARRPITLGDFDVRPKW